MTFLTSLRMKGTIQNFFILFCILNHATCSGQRSIGRSSYNSDRIERSRNPQNGKPLEHIPKNVDYSSVSSTHRPNVMFCRTSAQCSSLFPNSLCHENVCVCSPSQVYDAEEGVCRSPMAGLDSTLSKRSFGESRPTFLTSAGKPCNIAGFCGGGSFCRQTTGLCTCPRGTFIHNGACVRPRHLVQVDPQNPNQSHQLGTKNPAMFAVQADRRTAATVVHKSIVETEETQQVEQTNSPRVASPLRRRTAAFLCPMNVEPYFKIEGENKAYIMCNASRPTACPPLSYCFATGRALESGPYYCCPSN